MPTVKRARAREATEGEKEARQAKPSQRNLSRFPQTKKQPKLLSFYHFTFISIYTLCVVYECAREGCVMASQGCGDVNGIHFLAD
jgi:hypothetical protein